MVKRKKISRTFKGVLKKQFRKEQKRKARSKYQEELLATPWMNV
jgi:hypothetical protein